VSRAPGSRAGDYLRAIRALGADDDETRALIAKMLGLERAASLPPKSRGGDSERTAGRVSRQSAPSARREGGPSQPTRKRASAGRPLPATLSPTSGATPVPPYWLADTSGLADTLPSEPAGDAGAPPLFPALKTRGILTVLAGAIVEQRDIDLPRVVADLAARRPVTRFPHLPGLTLARGTQLLIDRSPATMPFWGDFTDLQRRLTSLLGPASLQIVEFAGPPLETAASPLRGGDEEDYRTQHTPPAGTQVVALTDLGIGWAGPGAPRSTATDWLALSRWLARCSC